MNDTQNVCFIPKNQGEFGLNIYILANVNSLYSDFQCFTNLLAYLSHDSSQ